MAFPISSKTIFVMDHTHWMREPSGIQIEIEHGNGAGSSGKPVRGAGLSYFTSFIPPVSKSLWTYAVESVLEYSRVVFDLFANERLLRFLLCQGQQGHLLWLNDWDLLDDGGTVQTLSYIQEKFGSVGPPPPQSAPSNKSNSVVAAMHLGIKSAIEALAQPTQAQVAFMSGQSGHHKSSLKAINRGRIICITSCTPQSVGKYSADDLENYFLKALAQHNRMASDHLLPILECEFVMVSLHPVGKLKFAAVSPKPMHELEPVLKSEVHVLEADEIWHKFTELVGTHYDLVSTTVTGIPMKEEQNSQSSSNYDVPLWHPRMPTSCFENSVLKWASPTTPKTVVGAGAGGLVHHCTSAVRITPVDVNSRPTTCLSTFVVSGRSVWLEMPKKGKAISHMLTSHGGEMWMHVVETARNVLEDPPSISEGVGGRCTDYRITDFAELIKMTMLVPYPKNYQEHVPRSKQEVRESGNPFIRRRSSSLEDLKKPIEMAKERLQRKTSYWPMTIGTSPLFTMSVHIESLLHLMPEDTISDLNMADCKKCIWNLMTVEARGEMPIPSGHHKKGKKLDEQWRSVYNELETFIRANQHSENHKSVLECFLESRRADSKVDSRSDDRNKKQEIDKALGALAGFGSSAASSTIADSPMSPPPSSSTGKSLPEIEPEKETKSVSGGGTVSKTSLLAMWRSKNEKKDFRVLTNTKLYAHLSTSTAEGDGNGNANKNGSTTGVKKVETKS